MAHIVFNEHQYRFDFTTCQWRPAGELYDTGDLEALNVMTGDANRLQLVPNLADHVLTVARQLGGTVLTEDESDPDSTG